MKIAFFGLPLAACLLHRDGHEIGLAVLSPIAAPGGRRLRRLVGAARIREASAPDIEQQLRAARPDLLVSWFWTRRLPEAWLAVPRLGAVGVHPSLLPRHRGPDPFFAAIDAGDETTGVTLHRLDVGYDTGPILMQVAVPIGDRDAWQLARALDRPALRLLREGVRRMESGPPWPERTQDEAQATWAPGPTDPELRVDWRWPTTHVLRRVRALSPVPGLAIEVRGQRLFATRARAVPPLDALEPGEANVRRSPAGLEIRTGDGAIAVEAAVVGEGSGLPAGAVLDAAGIVELIDGAEIGPGSPGRKGC